jgi:hypothetical protein
VLWYQYLHTHNWLGDFVTVDSDSEWGPPGNIGYTAVSERCDSSANEQWRSKWSVNGQWSPFTPTHTSTKTLHCDTRVHPLSGERKMLIGSNQRPLSHFLAMALVLLVPLTACVERPEAQLPVAAEDAGGQWILSGNGSSRVALAIRNDLLNRWEITEIRDDQESILIAAPMVAGNESYVFGFSSVPDASFFISSEDFEVNSFPAPADQEGSYFVGATASKPSSVTVTVLTNDVVILEEEIVFAGR